MSLLPTSVYAGPTQGEALWAVAGSVGPGGGVTQLVAGSGIILDPSTGEGVVTITSTGGGGGGGVTSVTASGAGITATPTSGAVVVANTGVTSLVAGAGMAVSSATGAVTISATAPYTTGSLTVSGNLVVTQLVNFQNIQGTINAPFRQTGGLSWTGTVGYAEAAYDAASSSWVFNATISGGSGSSSVMVMPTGGTDTQNTAGESITTPTVTMRNLTFVGAMVPGNILINIKGTYVPGPANRPIASTLAGFFYLAIV
jgi:hypothetical protein